MLVLPPRGRGRWASTHAPHHRRGRRGHRARRDWRRRASTLGVLGLLSALVLGAGIASAAWLSFGNGTATSRAGQALAPTTTTVAGTAITTNLLYPGSTGDVKLTVNNPNPYPVTLASVTQNGTVTASGGLGTGSSTGRAGTIGVPTSVTVGRATWSGTLNTTASVPVSWTAVTGAQQYVAEASRTSDFALLVASSTAARPPRSAT